MSNIKLILYGLSLLLIEVELLGLNKCIELVFLLFCLIQNKIKYDVEFEIISLTNKS